jgi:hypothetical protein
VGAIVRLDGWGRGGLTNARTTLVHAWWRGIEAERIVGLATWPWFAGPGTFRTRTR